MVVLVAIIVFIFHNLKGKGFLELIFLRFCRYPENDSNDHLLTAVYVSDTVRFHGLSCSIFKAAISGFLVKEAESYCPTSHR